MVLHQLSLFLVLTYGAPTWTDHMLICF